MTISTRPNDDVRNAPARSVSSSGEPGAAPPPSPPLQSDLAGDDFAAIVRDLATQSSSQTDFLGRLAAELLSEFSIATVALSHHRLSSPIVLAAAPGPPDGLDDRRLTQLLARATSSATACDVPLRRKSDSSADRLPTTGTEPRTRGLHIMLNEKSGDRGSCALLLVYAVDAVPDPITQIRDLQRLADVATCCRSALGTLADADSGEEIPARESPPVQPAEFLSSVEHERALRHFHHDLDVTGTAYRIANEARRVLAVDRVTVLIKRRGRLRIESVSGVAVVDRRANSVAAVQRLAERTIALRRAIALPTAEPLPPQIDEALDHYLDETDVASVVLIPLSHSPLDQENEPTVTAPQPFAMLLLESFSGQPPLGITPAMNEVGAEAAIALANANEHHRIFGLRFLKALGDWFGGHRLPYSVFGLIAIACLLAAGSVIQIDHKIIATGFAEPANQQHVFARSDGVVKEVLVQDGQQVAAGQLLLRLENTDLETHAETLSGDIQTTSRRLASIGSMLLDPTTDEKQASRLAIEQRQLQSELNGLQTQLLLVQQQIAELEIVSPIDGMVSGWQLKRKLSDRPVSRGNQLLTLVPIDGPWQLRLEILDKDAAELMRARTAKRDLQIQFAAASNPESTFSATLDTISTAARRNGDGVTVIDAVAIIHPVAMVDPRGQGMGTNGPTSFVTQDAHAGVETTAKIICGRRSILGSWFGDLADFMHRNVLFYLR